MPKLKENEGNFVADVESLIPDSTEEKKAPSNYKLTEEHKEFERALTKYVNWRIERKAKGGKSIPELISEVTSLDELKDIQEAVSERFYCLKHPRGPRKDS